MPDLSRRLSLGRTAAELRVAIANRIAWRCIVIADVVKCGVGKCLGECL